MATTTTNYGLVKPADNETADIAVLNQNADKIDAQMKANANAGANHASDAVKHIGTATKTTPVDADSVALVDSADTSKVKRLSWSALKTALASVFAAKVHKSNHAVGGSDVLTPSDIGAVATSTLDIAATASTVAKRDTDGSVHASMLCSDRQLTTDSGYGGALMLKKPPINTTLSGNILFYASGNSLNIIEDSGTFRGATLDIGTCAANVASQILHTGNTTIDVNPTANTVVKRDVNGDLSASTLISTRTWGNDGGLIQLQKPPTNTTLGGNPIIYVGGDSLFFSEGGGAWKAAYLNLAGCYAGSEILHTNNIGNLGMTKITTGSFTPNSVARTIDIGVNAKFVILKGDPVFTSSKPYRGIFLLSSVGIVTAETFDGQSTSVVYYSKKFGDYLDGSIMHLSETHVNSTNSSTPGTVTWYAIL